MTDEERQRELEAAAKRRREELDAAIAAFTLALSRITSNAQTIIEDLVDRQSDNLSSLSLLRYLNDQIAARLDQLGYTHLIRDTVRQYPDAINAVMDQLSAADITASLTRDDVADLATLQSIDTTRLTRLRTNIAATIAESVAILVITQQPKRDVRDAIAKPLDSLQSHALQIIEAGLFTADRYVYWQAFSKTVNRWLFFGPRDSHNRRFCSEHVGNVYTKEEILQMRNGNLEPVWLYQGGWFCRHSWIPQITQ